VILVIVNKHMDRDVILSIMGAVVRVKSLIGLVIFNE